MLNWVSWWWPGFGTVPETVVSRADLDDCPDLADLHATGFSHVWSADELASLLRQDGVVAYVARRANLFGTRSPVGFVLVRAVADEAEILTIAVAPSHRKRGVGRMLMDHAFRSFYHDRIASVFLEVDEGNPSALALYRRLGFVKVGERKGYYAGGTTPGATALVMKAELG